MVYLGLIFTTNGKDTEEFIMRLPKQTKPVMRNTMHNGQINSGIMPSGCGCPDDTPFCTGTCSSSNGVYTCSSCSISG